MEKNWQELYLKEQDKRKQVNETWKAHYTNVLDKYKEALASICDKDYKISLLTTSNKSIVSAFVNMLELSQGIITADSRRIADHAMILGICMQLTKAEIDDLYFAGLMYNIGIIFIHNKNNLSKEEQEQLPWLSQMALLSMECFSSAGDIILQHREKLDGTGYPKGLIGSNISKTAQILSVVVDYHEMVNTQNKPDSQKIKAYFDENKGKRYNFEIVEKFFQILELEKNQATRNELQIENKRLEPGMIISRHIYTRNNLLLLPKHHVLTEKDIEALTSLEQRSGQEFRIFIKRGKFNELTDEQKYNGYLDQNIKQPEDLDDNDS